MTAQKCALFFHVPRRVLKRQAGIGVDIRRTAEPAAQYQYCKQGGGGGVEEGARERESKQERQRTGEDGQNSLSMLCPSRKQCWTLDLLDAKMP